jgi:hypothetical protein
MGDSGGLAAKVTDIVMMTFNRWQGTDEDSMGASL